MAGETRVYFGSTKTLESSGAAISNNSIGEADNATYAIASDGNYYPDAEFVLVCQFSSNPTINRTLDLYARELDIDGTLDATIPTAAYRTKFLGSFSLLNTTSQQVIRLLAFDVPPKASYYLYNNNTGQSLPAGWTLKVTPRTYGPAS